VSLQLLRATFAENSSIAPSLRIVQNHGLVEKLETVHFVNGAGCGINAVKDDECLALGLQVGLRDDLKHIAELREDLFQCNLELFNLDSLL
jgi:hypothetical protein